MHHEYTAATCRPRQRVCPRRVGRRSSSLPTATRTTSRSHPSRSGSATQRFGCSRTTVRSPGPILKVAQGSTITVRVTNRGDVDATVHWHGLRLENRYDGTHDTQAPIPRRRDVHVSRPLPGSGRLLVPPAHSRGLRAGDGPLRQHPRRAGGNRLLAAGASRAAVHVRRHPHRGRQDRAVQPRGDDARGDGPVRQRHARLGGARAVAGGEARRGRPLLPHEHRQHADLQRRVCRALG